MRPSRALSRASSVKSASLSQTGLDSSWTRSSGRPSENAPRTDANTATGPQVTPQDPLLWTM
jgi:hypothetical protein